MKEGGRECLQLASLTYARLAHTQAKSVSVLMTAVWMTEVGNRRLGQSHAPDSCSSILKSASDVAVQTRMRDALVSGWSHWGSVHIASSRSLNASCTVPSLGIALRSSVAAAGVEWGKGAGGRGRAVP